MSVVGPRIYTKKRGFAPDLHDPVCMRPGATIEDVCHSVHRSLASHFKSVVRMTKTRLPLADSARSFARRYALVWGKSSKFSPQPQKVGLSHVVANEDVVSIFTK